MMWEVSQNGRTEHGNNVSRIPLLEHVASLPSFSKGVGGGGGGGMVA